MGSQEALHDDRYRAFVERLRKARTASGWSQEEVATRLGRSQRYVSYCETGERRVDAVEFMEFCNVYGLEPSWFISKSE